MSDYRQQQECDEQQRDEWETVRDEFAVDDADVDEPDWFMGDEDES